MKYVKMIRTFLLLLLMIFASATPTPAQQQLSGSGMGSTLDKVKVRSVARQDTLRAGAEAEFAFVMDIKDGWHLNAHNPTLDYLIGVELNLEASDIAMVSDIQYPQALKREFTFADDELKVYEGESKILVKLKSSNKIESGNYSVDGKLTIQACSDKVCLPPSTVDVSLPITVGQKTITSNHEELFKQLHERTITSVSDSGNQIASMFNEKGAIWAFLSIFLIGLALNLTPCVYPMMSVTVSLFGGNEKKSGVTTVSAFNKALVYVLGIVFMYSLLGVMAAYTGELFGSWMQSPWVLAGIGILIFLLSLSMFGLYELQPPAWMMQKLGKTQQASGFIGHFMSGLLVGVFAAPCIGPPIIALLAFVGAQGNPVFGFLAFFVMALGLGLPYLILGTFSGLLTKMPQSGVWMIWVKKVFGVVLVGVALFYVALAFNPEYSMYMVLATLAIGGIYLGFIESSGNDKLSFRWLKYAVGAGALVAGFLLFQNLQVEGVQWNEYHEARLTETQKPIMLDFYADWCIPCIELDRKTFTDSRVVEKTESFIRMKVDLTHFDSEQAEKLREEYNIAGVPTILFLDAEGEEVEGTRVVGFVNADKFLKKVDQVSP